MGNYNMCLIFAFPLPVKKNGHNLTYQSTKI